MLPQLKIHKSLDIARELGSQSVIVVLDIKKKRFGREYEVWTHNGTRNSGKMSDEFGRTDGAIWRR